MEGLLLEKSIGKAKLTANDVIRMKQLFKEGTERQDLSNMFNITRSYVRTILTNHRWKHLLESPTIPPEEAVRIVEEGK